MYDVDGARKAGLTDQQIAEYLGNKHKDKYNYEDAVAAGVPPTTIINHLVGKYEKTAPVSAVNSGLQKVSHTLETSKDMLDDAGKLVFNTVVGMPASFLSVTPASGISGLWHGTKQLWRGVAEGKGFYDSMNAAADEATAAINWTQDYYAPLLTMPMKTPEGKASQELLNSAFGLIHKGASAAGQVTSDVVRLSIDEGLLSPNKKVGEPKEGNRTQTGEFVGNVAGAGVAAVGELAAYYVLAKVGSRISGKILKGEKLTKAEHRYIEKVTIDSAKDISYSFMDVDKMAGVLEKKDSTFSATDITEHPGTVVEKVEVMLNRSIRVPVDTASKFVGKNPAFVKTYSEKALTNANALKEFDPRLAPIIDGILAKLPNPPVDSVALQIAVEHRKAGKSVFTLKGENIGAHKKRFEVPIYPDRTVSVANKVIRPSDAHQFINANADVFIKDSQANIKTSFNKADGKSYISIIKLVNTKKEAVTQAPSVGPSDIVKSGIKPENASTDTVKDVRPIIQQGLHVTEKTAFDLKGHPTIPDRANILGLSVTDIQKKLVKGDPSIIPWVEEAVKTYGADAASHHFLNSEVIVKGLKGPNKQAFKKVMQDIEPLLKGKAIQNTVVSATTPDAVVKNPAIIDSGVQGGGLNYVQGRARLDFIEEGFTEKVLSLPTMDKVIAAAEEVFAVKKIIRDPSKRISVQIAEGIGSGKISLKDIDPILTKHGVTRFEFYSQMYLPSLRVGASSLGKHSALLRRLGLAKFKSEETAILSNMKPRWKRMEDVRRALTVTQLATLMRNISSQMGRLGLGAVEGVVDAGLQRILGAEVKHSPLEGVEAFLNVFKGKETKKIAALLQENFPTDYDRAFSSYLSDIPYHDKVKKALITSAVDTALDKMERGAQVLNYANTTQEFIFRRAILTAVLDSRLKQKGVDLRGLVKRADPLEIQRALTPEIVREAVNTSLEYTFAMSPKHGTVWSTFIQLTNQLPGATVIVPFPRFLYNSLRFQFEFSPLGFTRLLSPKELKLFSEGYTKGGIKQGLHEWAANPAATKAMSRAIIGTTMLYTAWQIRNSKYAGDKWHSIKLDPDNPESKQLNLQAYAPILTPHLFVADVIKRRRDNTLDSITTKDWVQGIASTNFRAGAGLYVLDQISNGLLASGTGEEGRVKAVDTMKGIGGAYAASWLVPLQTVDDAIGEFDSESAKLRERKTSPFLDPIIEGIPLVKKTLPEVKVPTTAQTPYAVHPLMRQLTGLSLTNPGTPLERELTRLGFQRTEILSNSGNAIIDREMAIRMGPLMDKFGVPFVQSAQYGKWDDKTKAVILKRLVSAIRSASRESLYKDLAQTNPQVLLQLKLNAIPRRERLLLMEKLRLTSQSK